MLAPGIRRLLHQRIDRTFAPGAVVVDEYGVGGVVSDVAVFARDALHLYEIKSDADSTRRLPRQAEVYSLFCSAATLVAGPRMLERAAELVPAWWGLARAVEGGLVEERPALVNPTQAREYVAEILWSTEAWAEVQERGLGRGLSRRGGETWRGILVEALELAELRATVHRHVSARTWFQRKRLKVRTIQRAEAA
jgi:hypothetical protein